MAACLKLQLGIVPVELKHPKPNWETKISELISDPTTLPLLEKCTNIRQLKQFQAHMLRIGLFSDPYSASRLLTFCALSRFGSLDYALQVFDEIPQPNLYMWNTIIRGHASSYNPGKSLVLFNRMLKEANDPPNKFTFPFVIKAISELLALREGKGIHGMVVKTGFDSDVFVVNSLIHFYAACGDLKYAHQMFVKSPHRDVVSWNSMITGYAQRNCPEEALELFREMETENVKPNDITMVSVISACAKKGDLELGRWFHSYIERNGISSSLILNNSMLDMFTKCGSVHDAQQLFDKMRNRDSVSWTTMLVGYAKSGEFEASRQLFDQMPSRDIASWNALISAYEQSGQPRKALAVFHELQLAKAKPDEVTLVSTLSACAQLGAMDLGSWIHVYISKQSFGLNFHLTTALIDMYTKCGNLEKALEVFRSAEKKDVFVWSAMIAGLAMHGYGESAIDLFLQMQEAKVKPNEVTFTNFFCACSHAGLVDVGKHYFDQMLPVYGISPKIEHYGCMVDIIGRAGLLEEAMDFIKKMPIPPHASVWGALLGACRIHGNVELGELACKKLLELEPRNDGAHVLLSNIYAKAGQWDNVTRVRKMMRDRGLKKEPGCSLIEVDGVVNEFLVGDISHPLSGKIYSKLDEIALALRSKGYVPNSSQILQDIEEEDAKEQALYLHSEKLAIAFGLITTSSPAPIRIVKNLRVCGDCHEAAKLISSAYDRVILLRDRYRFHHFKGGSCSCKDYW